MCFGASRPIVFRQVMCLKLWWHLCPLNTITKRGILDGAQEFICLPLGIRQPTFSSRLCFQISSDHCLYVNLRDRRQCVFRPWGDTIIVNIYDRVEASLTTAILELVTLIPIPFKCRVAYVGCLLSPVLC